MVLAEYLNKVYNLEKSCYEQQQLLAKMNDGLWQANHPNLKDRLRVDNTRITAGDILGEIVSFVVFALVWNTVGSLILSIFVDFGSKKSQIGAVIMVLLGLCVYIGSAISRAREKRAQREDVLRTNQAIDLDNQRLCKELNIRASALSQRVKTGNAALAATQQILRQYYSLNIIYPKYRNLIAVSRFCEYISSGRCSQLTGHEGAYNLYEHEAEMHQIVKKLDEVIDRLDQIGDTQYLLARAIREGNRTAENIYRSVRNIEEQGAVTAYYSRLAAANSIYLAWFKKNS